MKKKEIELLAREAIMLDALHHAKIKDYGIAEHEEAFHPDVAISDFLAGIKSNTPAEDDLYAEVFQWLYHDIIKPQQQRISVLEYKLSRMEKGK